MSYNLLPFILFILFLVFLYKWLISTKTSKVLHLPPGPPKLPFIGNLHQLGKLPHRSLRSLSQKYGDLMLLNIGKRPTLVVSSANAAEEIMKTHDLVFANRPNLRFINQIFYNGNDIAFSSYGEKWRYMKSICMMQLLSKKMVQSFRPIREEEVARVIEEIKGYDSSVINLSGVILALFKGMINRTALGRTCAGGDGDDDESGTDFYRLFKELTEVMGKFSVGDYIPNLGWVDRLSGLARRAENVRKQFDDFIEGIIQEHEIRLNANQMFIDNNNGDHKGKNIKDFVDVLLKVQRENPEFLSRDNIKAITLDMFIAGTETSSTTVEWAMTELIRHPKIMKKLQKEIRDNVTSDKRLNEDDLENMKYLKAVIKETFRVHPPAPLLLFRESSEDIKIDNYDIATKTQVIINAWAIQHDDHFWEHPFEFNPERFMNDGSSIDVRGQHFQFIPLGAGRRGCPGASYAMVSVELVLASLVYEFNWSLPNGRQGEILDVAETVGTVARRLNPLKVIATPTVHYR